MRQYAAQELNLKADNIGLGVAPLVVAAPYIATGLSIAASAIWAAVNKRGQRKVATTQIVNSYEPLLQQNLAAWQESNKTVSEQALALENFDTVWSQVKSECSDPSMGKPGQWCIDDRARGGKWDWFARYRDPIASDATIPDPTTTEVVQSTLDSYLPSVGGMELGPLLAIGMVGLGLFSLLGGKK